MAFRRNVPSLWQIELCFSVEVGPLRNGEQHIEIEDQIALMVGSRSAPIGDLACTLILYVITMR